MFQKNLYSKIQLQKQEKAYNKPELKNWKNENKKRNQAYQSLSRWGGTSIIHSGSISCLANHLRASLPLSLDASSTLETTVVGSSVSCSVSRSNSGSDWGDDGKERRDEARARARAWELARCSAWRWRASSRRRCWSEMAARLNGRRRSCGAIAHRLLFESALEF